jgi:hypothetical protein
LALARSPNAKVVVIGTARDGMPLILGGADISGPSGSPTSGETGSAALAKSEVPVDTPPPPIFDQQSITPPMPADQSAPLTQTLRKNQIRRPNALDTVRAPSSASAVDVSPSSATADEAHRE